MVYISSNLVNRILKEAKTSYPFECCGLLVGNSSKREVCEVYPVENKNKVRAKDRYEIDSKKFDEIDRKAAKKGLNIIGIYHSHPDHPAEPSAYDKECASAWTEYSYLIISVRDKKETEIKSWYFNQDKNTVEEEGLSIRKRKFVFGISLIIFSFVVYFSMPFIFFLPLSLKVKASSVSISYFFSWGLTVIGIYFTGREGYESIRHATIGFLKKITGKNKNE